MTMPRKTGDLYRCYVLLVLFLVYMANFVDRQILAILAEDIKRDLGISDAEIGFLYGTVFSLFYAVFGIPLGRLADRWNRTRLIAGGLALWSLMTALSGVARSFAALTLCRIGVGIGEASSGPAASSIIADYFPARVRATVMGIMTGGIYFGMGVGVFLGGFIVDGWNGAFPSGGPLGLVGWQAAFIAVGIPGVFLAGWVATLREPQRGASEGLTHIADETPSAMSDILWDLVAVLPPFALLALRRDGATRRHVLLNLVAGLALAAMSLALWWVAGGALQWAIVGYGLYAALSWAQRLALRDPVAFRLIFRTRSFIGIYLGFPLAAFATYGLGFWSIPYVIRAFGADPADVGMKMGLAMALGGWGGILLGGLAGDRLKRRHPSGRLYVGVASIILACIAAILFLNARTLTAAYGFALLFNIAMPMWITCSHATCLDLVLPRMRASAFAFSVLAITIVGQANGPFVIGAISDGLSGGESPAEALRLAMIGGLAANGLAIPLLLYAARHLPGDERTRLSRARAAGEPIP